MPGGDDFEPWHGPNFSPGEMRLMVALLKHYRDKSLDNFLNKF